MTKKELESVYYINKECQRWEEKLQELRNQSKVKSPQITGLPTGKGIAGDTTAKLAVAQAEYAAIIAGLLAKVQMKRREIMEFIDSIDDMLIREIVEYRCIHLMSWYEVADAIGGGNTYYGVKKKYYRFLKKMGIK